MKIYNELSVFEQVRVALTVLLLFLASHMAIEWVKFDLSDTLGKSFFVNGLLSLRTTVYLVASASLLSLLNSVSPLHDISSLGKLMLIEAGLTGIVTGLLYLKFTCSTNLPLFFYESAFDAMFVGGLAGLFIAWLIRGLFVINSINQPGYSRY